MTRKVCNFSKPLSHVYFIRGCILQPELKPPHVSHSEGNFWYASCPASCFTNEDIVKTCDIAELYGKKPFLVDEEELAKLEAKYGKAFDPDTSVPEKFKGTTPAPPEPKGGLLNFNKPDMPEKKPVQEPDPEADIDEEAEEANMEEYGDD